MSPPGLCSKTRLVSDPPGPSREDSEWSFLQNNMSIINNNSNSDEYINFLIRSFRY